MLWRRGASIWKAKGYSHTAAADAFEEKFGANKGLGRSRIALLVTTQREPCPPKVADFILNEMKVLNEETWAEYLREVENEPPDEEDAAPVAVSEPREVRELAREAVGEFAGMIRGWFDTLLSATSGKMDAVQTDINHVDAQVELLQAKADHGEAKREKDKRELIWDMRRTVAVGVLTVIVVLRWLTPTPGTAPGFNVFCMGGEVMDPRQIPPSALQRMGQMIMSYGARTSGSGIAMGERKTGWAMPHQPLPNQATGTCRPGETSLFNACWLKIADQSPPCLPGFFAYGNACYSPVAADPKTPVGSESQ